MDDLRKDNAEKLIQLSDLEKDAKLVTRYHHKAILRLIAKELFHPAAHTIVQSLAHQMQDNLKEGRNRKRKEMRLQAKPQRILFQWFSQTASSSSTASHDESASSESKEPGDSDYI